MKIELAFAGMRYTVAALSSRLTRAETARHRSAPGPRAPAAADATERDGRDEEEAPARGAAVAGGIVPVEQ
eukprot:2719835-Prymnesium_polylepis.1